jgi:small subunit ribosomal protein S17
MPRRVEIGVVVSDKAAKTRCVEIPRAVKHPRYGKYVRRRTICHVHDEENTSRMGDVVEIEESRPRSRLKRWALLRVLEKSRLIDLAEIRARARRHAEQPQPDEEAAGAAADQPTPGAPAGEAPPEEPSAGPSGGGAP